MFIVVYMFGNYDWGLGISTRADVFWVLYKVVVCSSDGIPNSPGNELFPMLLF